LSNKYRCGGFKVWQIWRQDLQPEGRLPGSGMPDTENPAREEVRRVSDTDQQPGGGGVVGPVEGAGRRSAPFDDLKILDARLKNRHDFAPQHCAICMAVAGA